MRFDPGFQPPVIRLASISVEDLDPTSLAVAIQALDAEAAADGAWQLPDGSVFLLEVQPDGFWRIRAWEPAD